MYDAHSARLLRMTDWRRHGAIKHPPASLRQWGRGLNETELSALGQARLSAASQGSGSAPFWQFHPSDQRAHILCRADVIAAGGWEIILLDEKSQPTGWILKADRGAELHCDCHCEWRPDCPGVVSVPATSRRDPPAPPDRAEDGNHKVATESHAQSEIVIPEGWRWPSAVPASENPGSFDRGELHMHREQYEPSPAMPAPQSLPRRRGFFAALFGGVAVPAAVAEPAAPSVPAEWRWPEAASGAEYRGELHEPEPATLSWAALEFPPTFDVPAIEHYAASWDAPELSASDAPMIGWDTPAAAWGDPAPAYAALPAPETEPLSTQAEIDNFIEVAWETAPAIEPDAPSNLQWLPAPEVTETSNDGGNGER